MKTIRQKLFENCEDVLENGPRLSYNRNTWIVAKDTKNGRVLIGGLGALGVGQMWRKAEEHDRSDPEYEAAPEKDSTGGFGT